jgi:hypothetical protein
MLFSSPGLEKAGVQIVQKSIDQFRHGVRQRVLRPGVRPGFPTMCPDSAWLRQDAWRQIADQGF